MYGQFMLKMAEECESLMVLSADLGRSSGLDRFKAQYPDKYLSVGISEQNLIGIASGLAREGHKVFISSFAPFLSMRSSEQIRNEFRIYGTSSKYSCSWEWSVDGISW